MSLTPDSSLTRSNQQRVPAINTLKIPMKLKSLPPTTPLPSILQVAPQAHAEGELPSVLGSNMIVQSAGVVSPVVVRYGCANVPDVNLYNAAGLPVACRADMINAGFINH